MGKIVVYHGSSQIVKTPMIRITRYNKDFYFGFYCTIMKEQARRWATRFGEKGYINIYEYNLNQELNMLVFENFYGLRQFTAAVAADCDHRCGYCYACRMERTAQYAAQHGFARFSTTLLVSPYQNRELIRAAGERMGERYGVEFAAYDFRPRFQEGQEEARAAGLYLQKYCGCVYSEEERFSNRRKKELHKLHKAATSST